MIMLRNNLRPVIGAGEIARWRGGAARRGFIGVCAKDSWRSTQTRFFRVIVVAVGALVGVQDRAVAVTPAVLIDAQLKPQAVHLQSLEQGQLNYFDTHRQWRAAPLEQFVSIVVGGQFSAPAAPAQEAGAKADALDKVTTTDGQEIVGHRAQAADSEEGTLGWRHRWLGEMTIPLDKISAVSLGRASSIAASSKADWVSLANGDSVNGLILAVGSQGVRIEADGQTGQVLLPWESVRQIALANPPANRPAAAHEIQLADGTRVFAQTIHIGSDKLAFEPLLTRDRRSVTVPLAEVAKILLGASNGRVVDLATLPWNLDRAGTVFGVSIKPIVEPSGIRLHGPVAVTFRLPPGSRRLAAVLTLDRPSASADLSAWADCQVAIRLNGRVIATARLSGDVGSVPVNCPVTEGELTIEVTEGSNGPIGDRVVVQEGMVYVRQDPVFTD